jgi:protein arginine kinase activator
MKCDYCDNKATLEITEVLGDKIYEHHICETCLAETLNEIMRMANGDQSLSRLTRRNHRGTQKQLFKCDNCGHRYREVSDEGVSQCPRCSHEVIAGAKSNKKKNRQKDKAFHPANRVKHIVDQKPQPTKIEMLRKALKSAIEKEEYEKAAHLRDAIKKMEHHN